MITSTTVRRFGSGLVVLAAVTATLAARADQLPSLEPVTWAWSAPQSGSAVSHYIVEVAIDGGEFVVFEETTATSFTLTDPLRARKYEVRVRAVGVSGRSGPYSPVSDPWDTPIPRPGSAG
ncbi:MAG: fibronectin type III domain-containing protein [Candidatus Krumholzibacteriia bacterium]